MKFLRYGDLGAEKPGLLDKEGRVRGLSGVVADFAGPTVSTEALAELAAIDPADLPLVDDPGRIGACLAHVPNFFCIGLNYAKHAAEAGQDTPAEPILFSKAVSALSGPDDRVTIPKGSQKTDWEVELGVVIGHEAYRVTADAALAHVSGYCVINDISERSYQLDRGGQWIKGKSAPGFGPVGPWLVTADEVPDPQALGLSLTLNGEVMQDSTTADMIFPVAEIVSHLSEFMVLQPGDIIATGTPSGVGMGRRPQRFRGPGEVMELAVEGLGTQRQEVV